MYGQWPGQPDSRALHFELADLFAANNAGKELLSELLLLDTPAMREYDSRRPSRSCWRPNPGRLRRSSAARFGGRPLRSGIAGRSPACAVRQGELPGSRAKLPASGCSPAGRSEITRAAQPILEVTALDPMQRRLAADEIVPVSAYARERCARGLRDLRAGSYGGAGITENPR
jgi:hypothetical protein